MTTILSAAFGDLDLKPKPIPKQTVDHQAILVSDRPYDVEGWDNVIVDIPHENDRMKSKMVKCHPWEHEGVCDTVVWVDAQFHITSPDFLAWVLEEAGDAPLSAHRHNMRKSIHVEALAGQGPAGRGRFDGQDSIGQAEHYIQSGHPDDWGLWSTGLNVRHRSPEVENFGTMWLLEQMRWSTHDQISFPYVARNEIGSVNDITFLGWKNQYYSLQIRKAK